MSKGDLLSYGNFEFKIEEELDTHQLADPNIVVSRIDDVLNISNNVETVNIDFDAKTMWLGIRQFFGMDFFDIKKIMEDGKFKFSYVIKYPKRLDYDNEDEIYKTIIFNNVSFSKSNNLCIASSKSDSSSLEIIEIFCFEFEGFEIENGSDSPRN